MYCIVKIRKFELNFEAIFHVLSTFFLWIDQAEYSGQTKYIDLQILDQHISSLWQWTD